MNKSKNSKKPQKSSKFSKFGQKLAELYNIDENTNLTYNWKIK